jgi:hypothetical protein
MKKVTYATGTDEKFMFNIDLNLIKIGYKIYITLYK